MIHIALNFDEPARAVKTKASFSFGKLIQTWALRSLNSICMGKQCPALHHHPLKNMRRSCVAQPFCRVSCSATVEGAHTSAHTPTFHHGRCYFQPPSALRQGVRPRRRGQAHRREAVQARRVHRQGVRRRHGLHGANLSFSFVKDGGDGVPSVGTVCPYTASTVFLCA